MTDSMLRMILGGLAVLLLVAFLTRGFMRQVAASIFSVAMGAFVARLYVISVPKPSWLMIITIGALGLFATLLISTKLIEADKSPNGARLKRGA